MNKSLESNYIAIFVSEVAAENKPLHGCILTILSKFQLFHRGDLKSAASNYSQFIPPANYMFKVKNGSKCKMYSQSAIKSPQ